ncbi:MAG: tRNA (N(6)-L-threonylcarbamoyladenosine(37)-C(2))-methylthiotransferase MtaB, partial [Leptonema sp. (in: Bacteria)]|nr:tRNA (N(6)-L-threonylcarbamoyladenosine(37)-C(2))-methylthiotransferase MtaB [Leptonema sp. (in: bacteria)]
MDTHSLETAKTASPENTLSVGIHTLGCRLNQYESDGIIGKFGDHHYKIVPFSEGPDIAIINTCTVTESADSKNRNIVRQVLKRNPNAKVFVTGCYAQTDPEKLIGIRGVRAVVGNDRKSHLFDIIEEMLFDDGSIAKRLSDGAIESPNRGKRRIVRDPFGYGKVFPVGHSRAYLKIQDGCDRKCSYCKIPQARGGGVSRELEEVIDHLTQIDEAKIPEIVLTGVNLGWYRQNEIRFTDLLLTMLDRLQYSRIRLSSIEPSD